jgi:signal transduction histidine kinase
VSQLQTRALPDLALTASVAVWLTVFVASTGMLGMPGDGHGWPAVILLLVFLAAWLAGFSESVRRRQPLIQSSIVVLALAQLGLFALGSSGSTGVLVLLLAIRLAEYLPMQRLWWSLALINGLIYLIMLGRWQVEPMVGLIMLVPTAALQVFAALVLIYASRAQATARELGIANANLRATGAKLERAARDNERLALSRELHDSFGQRLTAMKLHLRQLCHQGISADDERMQSLHDLAAELLEDIRDQAARLRGLEDVSLADAIEELAASFPDLDCRINFEEGLVIEEPGLCHDLYRIVQEAITNAIRHGDATRVNIDLEVVDDNLRLRVTDNGHGCQKPQAGCGLEGITERVRTRHGRMEVQTDDQGRFVLQVEVPHG